MTYFAICCTNVCFEATNALVEITNACVEPTNALLSQQTYTKIKVLLICRKNEQIPAKKVCCMQQLIFVAGMQITSKNSIFSSIQQIFFYQNLLAKKPTSYFISPRSTHTHIPHILKHVKYLLTHCITSFYMQQ